MGKPFRRWWQAALAGFGMLVATSASAQLFDVSRLDGDPVPLEVLSGRHQGEFASVEGQAIHETSRRPRWWRLTAREAGLILAPALSPAAARIVLMACIGAGYSRVATAARKPDVSVPPVLNR